jgi:hypothetical protein
MAETLAEPRRVIFIRLPNRARGSPKSSSLRTIKDSKDVASLAAESAAATSLEVRGAVRARTSRPTSLPTSWSHLDARPTDYGPAVVALARTKPRRALPIAHNQIVCVTAFASAVVIVRKAVTDQCTITLTPSAGYQWRIGCVLIRTCRADPTCGSRWDARSGRLGSFIDDGGHRAISKSDCES